MKFCDGSTIKIWLEQRWGHFQAGPRMFLVLTGSEHHVPGDVPCHPMENLNTTFRSLGLLLLSLFFSWYKCNKELYKCHHIVK